MLSVAAGAPEGFFLDQATGKWLPCPTGTYKRSVANRIDICSQCPSGVTTTNEASASESACTVVLPGYYPTSLAGGAVKATQLCPRGYYCLGGVPAAAFNPAAPAVMAGTTVVACPNGTTTQEPGASTSFQCSTPV